MKELDEGKSETSDKKLVLRGDGSGELISIFSKGGKEIFYSDISESVSKLETSGKYFILETKSWQTFPLNCIAWQCP